MDSPSTSPAAVFDDDPLMDLPSSDPPVLSSDQVIDHSLPTASRHPIYTETSPMAPITNGPPVLEPIPDLREVDSDDNDVGEVPYGTPYPINNPHLNFVDDFGFIDKDGDCLQGPRGRAHHHQPTSPVSGVDTDFPIVPSKPPSKCHKVNTSVTPVLAKSKSKGKKKACCCVSALSSPD